MINGYTINERRLTSQLDDLNSLKKTVLLLNKTKDQKELTPEESDGLLRIISEYAYALDILDRYDYQDLQIADTSDKELYKISYEEAVRKINEVRKIYGNTQLFGKEKDNSFKSSISTIYQTFDKKDISKY